MTVTNIFEIINDFRRSAPVDVEGIAKALNIKIRYAPLKKEVSGMIECKNDEYFISINSNDSSTRQRFTLAHELGHYIYHRDKIRDIIEDNKLYRSSNISNQEETKANQFAASVLMPEELIKTLQANGTNDPKDLAKKLQVSLHSLYIRLGMEYKNS